MKSLNNYVGDELANKVKMLTKALEQATRIINDLETENNNLLDALNNLASVNKEDCVLDSEALCV